MSTIEVVQNTDNSFSSLQQEARGQSLCYFVHSRPLQFQYISSYSLKYIFSGSIHYQHKKEKKFLEKGDLMITKGNQEVRTCVGKQGAEGLAIFFKEEKINNLIYKELISEEFNIESPDICSHNKLLKQDIINICQELFVNLNDNYSSYSDIATVYERLEKGFVQNLLDLHCINLRKKISLKPSFLETIRKIAMAVDFIHSNYHKKINLEDIADKACMSKYCFLRHFKNFFLMTPNEYLLNHRINKATQLIKLKKMSIGSIAMDCGFGSPQYFNYTFRKKFGYTPSRLCA